MTVSVVQSQTGFATAGNLTFAATFDSPCAAGNAILWIIAGDKNSGTITPPADTPNLPITLKDPSNQVTVALAYGTADGGETVISGTVGANIAGGQVWILELHDDVNTGAWARWGEVTVTSDGTTNVTSLAMGPFTATRTGLAVASVGADSVNTAGTPSWSNSFTGQRVTPSGGGQAGQWGAIKAVTAGDSVSTTFDRTASATADQHSGFITVFARTNLPGAVDGQAPRATGQLTGAPGSLGALAGQAPAAVGALTGLQGTTGELGGSAPRAVGALTATETRTGALSGVAPAARGNLIVPRDFVLPLRAGPVSTSRGWGSGTPTVDAGWRTGPVTVGDA